MTEPELIPTLTQDERTVLMIAAEGEFMIPLGRWKPTVEALVQKGLMRAADPWNVYITSDGRKAIEVMEKAVDAEVHGVFRRYATPVEVKPSDGLKDAAPYGPSVVSGHLFFKLLDGSTVTCNCIGGRIAEQIVEACRATHRP